MNHDDTVSARVVAEARAWIGTPYLHQASLQGVGCDCLGLIRGVWRNVFGEEPEAMPAYSRDWAETRDEDTLVQAARRHLDEISPVERSPGDLLVFRWKRGRPAKHLAILTSPTHFVHGYEHGGTVESPLSDWWIQRLAHVFRFPDRLLSKDGVR